MGPAIWIVLATAGAGIIVMGLFSDSFEIDVPELDIEIGAEVIGAGLAGAGILGLVLENLGTPTPLTTAGAIGAGLVMALFAFFAVGWFLHTPTDATPDEDDFRGAIGKVITPVRPGKIGEVTILRHGQRWKMTAETDPDDPTELPAGTEIVVVSVVSPTRVLIAPIELPELDGEPLV